VATIPKRNEEWVKAEDVSTLLKARRQRRVRSAAKLTVAATGQKKSPNRCDSVSVKILRKDYKFSCVL